jgi:dTDP-glucose pyrophosphorylase
MNLLVPMSGASDAFAASGLRYGKYLVEIRGRPLIEHVWENLKSLVPDRVVFVVRKEDAQRNYVHDVIRLLSPNAEILQSDGPTRGAACTCLLAIEHISPEEELVISNGDQLILTDLPAVIADFRTRRLDAGTIVFESVHPRWSFVRLDKHDLLEEAAEKRPISRWATAGFYYFRSGTDFVKAAMATIRKDAQVGGQFYVCPTFNELLLRHAKIGVFRVPRTSYRSLATPQNVEEYEASLASTG